MSKDEAQVRGFRNSISDVFDLHEEEGNNSMFYALFWSIFWSPDYPCRNEAQVVDYMTANSEKKILHDKMTLKAIWYCWVIIKLGLVNMNFRHSQSYIVWMSKCTIEWHPQILCIIFHQDPTLHGQSGCFIQVITMIL